MIIQIDVALTHVGNDEPMSVPSATYSLVMGSRDASLLELLGHMSRKQSEVLKSAPERSEVIKIAPRRSEALWSAQK